MDAVTFLVQGSSSSPYVVSFSRVPNTILCKCSCPAGMKGQACKHRLRILRGSTENIISDNLHDVETVSSWLPGSEIERSLLEVERLESEASRVKNHLILAKKNLAKAMGS
jgi:hypothetical protein